MWVLFLVEFQSTPHPFAAASVPDGSQKVRTDHASFALFACIGRCSSWGNTFDWQWNVGLRGARQEIKIICPSRPPCEVFKLFKRGTVWNINGWNGFGARRRPAGQCCGVEMEENSTCERSPKPARRDMLYTQSLPPLKLIETLSGLKTIRIVSAVQARLYTHV